MCRAIFSVRSSTGPPAILVLPLLVVVDAAQLWTNSTPPLIDVLSFDAYPNTLLSTPSRASVLGDRIAGSPSAGASTQYLSSLTIVDCIAVWLRLQHSLPTAMKKVIPDDMNIFLMETGYSVGNN